MLLRCLLSVIRPIEVLPGQRGLAACHVPANDEMGAPIVFPNDHVLDRLTRAGHVHGVGEVCPTDRGVVQLLGKDFIGVVTDDPWDVVILCWAACGVYQADRSWLDIRSTESTSKKLVVRTVDGVSALECNDVHRWRKARPDLCRGLAREDSLGKLQSSQRSRYIVTTALHGNHLDRWMLKRGRAIAILCFEDFIGHPLLLNFHDSKILSVVGKEHLLAWRELLAVGVQDNREAEKYTTAR
mmetsp:Transcript_32661/g.77481  ORF Transcript_32661/g.77481 Transcript_32661/m.77481 type:complete len:241 (-) Transcript_32661:357-1079(-)